MEDENLKRCYALALSIVEKSAVKYLEEQSDENHRNLLFNLGNTGMMAFSQGDEFFNEFRKDEEPMPSPSFRAGRQRAERELFERENCLPGHESIENKGAVDFKSADAYHKWLAFGHMHDKFHGKEKVEIQGKMHKVRHENAFESGKAKALDKISQRMITGKWA